MAASIGLETSRSGQVVLLLLGEKQSGKSSAGNTILGRPAFNRNTIRSSRESGTIFGKQVTVVDTPGWSSHSSTPPRVSQEVCRGVSLCNPEPHAILLVLPTTSVFGQRELKAMEAQLKLLQTPIWQRAMVLFTHGDGLGAVSIQEHIRHQGQTLHWLLERCANRYQVMTNQPSASEAQIRELLEKIQWVMRTNSGSRETKNTLYTKLRRDLAVEESRQGRQEDMEMTNVYDVCDEAPGQKQRMASVGSRPVLSFILLGRRKSRKSSAGNFILDREEFKVHQYGQTSRCSVGHGSVSGRAVAVVDTPGWSHFGLTNAKKVKTEINRSTSLCPERSKIIFLLSIPVDSFTKKDKSALEEFVSVLGDSVWRRTVVLFTYREELRGTTIKKHIEKKGEPLQEVLQKCGQRHVVFYTGSGHGDQITQLLMTVDQM